MLGCFRRRGRDHGAGTSESERVSRDQARREPVRMKDEPSMTDLRRR